MYTVVPEYFSCHYCLPVVRLARVRNPWDIILELELELH
jgi:hypothetical protein